MKAVRHIGIAISDKEKALHFYRDLLGLKIIKDMNESGDFTDKMLGLQGVNVNTIKMKADDGNLIELLHFASHQESPDLSRKISSIGCTHVAFTVENLDEIYKMLIEEGIAFVSPPQIAPGEHAKAAFCKDPDGTFIELIEML